jgi:hypothetical protein
MVSSEQIQLIKRLKRYPRHGQVGPIQQVEAALKKLYELYKQGGDEIVKINVFGKIADQVMTTVNSLTILEQANSGIASTFNMNQAAAADFGKAIEKAARNQGISAVKAKEFATDLKSIFGGMEKAYTGQTKQSQLLLKQTDDFRNKLGETAEEYSSFLEAQLAAAKGSEKAFLQYKLDIASVAKAFEAKGIAGAFTDITTEFTKLNAATKMTFGQYPKQIALALLKTKSLGIELETITGAADGFLDVQETISKQYELQALTQRTIKDDRGEDMTNALTQARLQNDANRLVELYAQTVDKYSDKIKENPFAMEAVANYLNISKDDVAAIYTGMQKTKFVTDDVGTYLETNADQLRGTVATYNDILAKETELTTAEQSKQQLQDEQLKALDVTGKKIQDMNTAIMGNGEANAGAVTAVTNTIMPAVDKLVQLAGPLITGGATLFSGLNLGANLLDLITNTSTITTATPSENVPLGPTPKDDVFIPASNGTVVSGPFGSFALDPRDDVLAMPGIREATAPKSNVSGDAIASAVADALKGMSFHVTNVFDGRKIKSALEILDRSTLNNINVT